MTVWYWNCQPEKQMSHTSTS